MLQYKDLQTEGVHFLYGYNIAKLQRGIQYLYASSSQNSLTGSVIEVLLRTR